MARNSRKSGEGSILHLFASLPEDRPVLEAIALWTGRSWTPVSTLIRVALREWLDKQAGKRLRTKQTVPISADYQPRPAKWCIDLVGAIAVDGTKKKMKAKKKSVVLHVFLSASDDHDVQLAKDLEQWRSSHYDPPVSGILKAATLDFVRRHLGDLTDEERAASIDALRAAVRRTYPASAYTRRAAAEAAGAKAEPKPARVRRPRKPKVAAAAESSPAVQEPTS